jgi:hypothetical protein
MIYVYIASAETWESILKTRVLDQMMNLKRVYIIRAAHRQSA